MISWLTDFTAVTAALTYFPSTNWSRAKEPDCFLNRADCRPAGLGSGSGSAPTFSSHVNLKQPAEAERCWLHRRGEMNVSCCQNRSRAGSTAKKTHTRTHTLLTVCLITKKWLWAIFCAHWAKDRQTDRSLPCQRNCTSSIITQAECYYLKQLPWQHHD